MDKVVKFDSLDYARSEAFNHVLLEAAQAGQSVLENQINLLNNCMHVRRLKKQFRLQNLFIRYWTPFVKACQHQQITIRPAIMDNVEKMIKCRDLSEGHLYFDCPNCERYHIQGLSCHSRFCASCGKKYRDARTLNIAKKCIDVPHRQFVFSIAEELRPFFRMHRPLLDTLFKSVQETLDWLILGKSKRARKEKRCLGYIIFLHTFGRDLKFNPHLHVLVAEATLDSTGKRRNFDYFNYPTLRKSFMKQLLKNMRTYLSTCLSKQDLASFYRLTHYLYKTYQNGFYTHGPKRDHATRIAVQKAAEYVARYAGHPAMSEARILDIDETKHTITYYYDPHEDEHSDVLQGRQIVTESVFKFISKLILHIPDKHFHTIRHCGFYANRSRHRQTTQRKLYHHDTIKRLKKHLDWRYNLNYIYKYDVLLCVCGATMVLDLSASYLPKNHQKQRGG